MAVYKPALLLVMAMGWVFSAVESQENLPSRPLKILVPLKLGFQEFVSWEGQPPTSLTFSGFSVEVFERCVKRLPYNLSYEFVGFGDGVNDPGYNAMVQKLVDKEVDGVVADITITEDRMRVVDFTQPYIQSSLVMVVPFDYASYGQLWNFLLPFSDGLWASIGAVFLSTGLVIFILEHDNLHFHQEGLNWKTRLANVFWFTAMTVFFCQKADISTRLGRVLTVFWLMVVLILTSSYTASLTSILAAQKPSPSIKNFADLQKSNLAVGYQDGSFTPGYLEQSLYIRPARLVPLVKEQDYDAALELGAGRKGGVAAILDESPYIQTFLNSKCQYTTVGNEIAYFGGFGFAFQKNSSLTDDISLTIISLEQNGELQNIKDSWLGSGKCVISSTGTYIPLKNFGGLFIIIAIVYSVCIFLRNLGWILEACGQNKDQVVSPIEELYPSQDTEQVSPTEELHPPQHIVSLDPPQVSPIEELHPPQNTRPLDPLQVSPIEELHPPQHTVPPQPGASRERTNIRM